MVPAVPARRDVPGRSCRGTGAGPHLTCRQEQGFSRKAMACAETWISIRKETGVAAFCSRASLQLQADFVCNQTKVTWGHHFPATILVWETGTAAITGKCDVDNLSVLGIRRESNAFSGLQSSISGESRILMCSELAFCIKPVLSNLGMAMRCFSVQELSRVICTLLGPDQHCLGRKGVME